VLCNPASARPLSRPRSLSLSLAFTQTCTWSASGSLILALEQREHLLVLFVAKLFVLHADTEKRQCPRCRRGRARRSKPGPAGHNTWLRSMESLPPIWLDGPSIHNTPAPLFIFFAHAFNPPAVSTSCFQTGLRAITWPQTSGCEYCFGSNFSICTMVSIRERLSPPSWAPSRSLRACRDTIPAEPCSRVFAEDSQNKAASRGERRRPAPPHKRARPRSAGFRQPPPPVGSGVDLTEPACWVRGCPQKVLCLTMPAYWPQKRGRAEVGSGWRRVRRD
jgi:hypothetical protein